MMRQLLSGKSLLGALTALILFSGSSGAQCVGDCSADHEVTVDEIIVMVNIALGAAPVSSCTAGDSSADGEITVDEIIAAVNNSLNNCPVGGALGTRHFTLNPATSKFTAVLAPGFAIDLGGGFRGQSNGVTENAFMDLRAGEPDASGFTTIDVTDASDYFFVDGRPTAPLVLCLKPLVPVIRAGALQCNGGMDYSIGLSVNHHLGKVGVDAFTVADCYATCGSLGCGTLEGPNQVCATGLIGEQCAADVDCETTRGANDGKCGLGRYCLRGRVGEACTSNTECDTASGGDGICAVQPVCSAGTAGAMCRADSDCDTSPTTPDGSCGRPGAHPGVCNGPVTNAPLGGDSGPGAAVLAPVLGLTGLPAELTIESATPCGDEGPGLSQPFALTTGVTQASILNFSDQPSTCSDGSACAVNSDCDTADGGPGRGVCSGTLNYPAHGENFSCSEWTRPDGPGCFTLSVPSLDINPMGGDLITVFKFCGR